RSWTDLERAADPDRSGGAPRSDDDRISGQSADACHVSGRRAHRHRAQRASAVHGAVSVCRVGAHDRDVRRARSVRAVKTIRIGCGAGFSGDRIDPAVELATNGDLDYLVFECLAERTIALAQQAKARDARAGSDPLLADRMEAVLPACLARHTRII